MNEFVGLLIVSLAMWLSGYGAAMMMGQHGRYVSYSKRVARWFGSQAVSATRFMWRRYPTQIVWATIGFFLALVLLGPR